MTQDTRKDPRAKVLTMTVRYKSATLDEFIEHHSHDVSRGGMFIKTPSPFPPGTLLKFEVKIAAEQRVMQGVGRVVWKREASEISDARPAGMGVKFIKIDDESRKVIDQLITARGDAANAYDAGVDGRISSRPSAPGPISASGPASTGVPHARAHRKATMIGLGAMPSSSPGSAPASEPSDAFFPQSSDVDSPAPEDRTVMKQAAELLQDALREAGGSLEDVGTPRASSVKEAPKRAEPAAPAPSAPVAAAPVPTAPVAAAPASARAASEPAAAAVSAVALDSIPGLEDRPVSKKADESKKPPVPLPAAGRPPDPKPAVSKRAEETTAVTRKPDSLRPRAGGTGAGRDSEPTRKRAAAMQQAAAAEGGGGGKIVLMLLAAAAAIALVFWFNQRRIADAPEPEPESPVAADTAAVEPPAPAAEPQPSPEPIPQPIASEVVPSAAPPVSAAPVVSAPVAPNAVAPTPPIVKPPPAAVVPPAPKPRPAPKPVAPSAPEPAQPPRAAEVPSEPAPVKPAPVTPAPAKPAPAPAKPAPKPAPIDGDNPY